MTRFKRSLLASLSFGLALAPVMAMAAFETWINFKSAGGVYEARIPDDHKTTTHKFLISDEHAASSEETASLFDHRPYKNAMKSYVIKYDQTIGPALTEYDINDLLHHEFDRYVEYYKKLDGVIRSEKADGYKGNWGGEIYISYKDPVFGVQSIRARILFNETTRLQQIVVGTDDLMTSYQTRDFFDSLKFETGVSLVDETFKDTWKPVESPLGSFSILAPPAKAPPYYTTDPVVKVSGKNEMVGIAFHDPIREESIFFNVYGYQFSTDVTYSGAQEVLVKKHILKQRGSTKGLHFTQGTDDDKNSFIQTSYAITPPEAFPFMQGVRLRVIFAGKSMIVLETMTSNALFSSSLTNNLQSFVTYHPEKIHDAVATPPAAPAETVPVTPATEAPPAAPAKP